MCMGVCVCVCVYVCVFKATYIADIFKDFSWINHVKMYDKLMLVSEN